MLVPAGSSRYLQSDHEEETDEEVKEDGQQVSNGHVVLYSFGVDDVGVGSVKVVSDEDRCQFHPPLQHTQKHTDHCYLAQRTWKRE